MESSCTPAPIGRQQEKKKKFWYILKVGSFPKNSAKKIFSFQAVIKRE